MGNGQKPPTSILRKLQIISGANFSSSMHEIIFNIVLCLKYLVFLIVASSAEMRVMFQFVLKG